MSQNVPVLSSSNTQHVESACASSDLTADDFHALKRHATTAKSSAYCPYSKFNVGAAILTHTGTYIAGANVENASYPVGTCAERVAFGKAVTDGHRGFKAVAVATDIHPPASPCGMCRQFMREFCEVDMPILMFDKHGDFSIVKLGELLPLSFGPEALRDR